MLFKTRSGLLYIISERDMFNQAASGYYKIGIVRDEREAAERLREHQTGNPRELIACKILATDAVEYLETSLHHRLAANVASNEWFKLDEREYASLETLATDLVADLSSQVPLVTAAKQLEKVVSNGSKVQPDAAFAEMHREMLPDRLLAADLSKAIKVITDTQRTRAAEARGGSATGGTRPEPAAGIHEVVMVTRQTFDRLAFDAALPEVAARFQKTKVSPSFRMSVSKEIKAQLEAMDAVRDVLDAGADELPLMGDRDLEIARRMLDQQSAKHDWAKMKHEAIVRAEIGENEALIGVATWKRVLKSALDEAKLKAEEPEIYQKFVKTIEIQRIVRQARGLADTADDEDDVGEDDTE